MKHSPITSIIRVMDASKGTAMLAADNLSILKQHQAKAMTNEELDKVQGEMGFCCNPFALGSILVF